MGDFLFMMIQYTMKTFMKWAGNKSSIVDIISPHLNGKKLVEPFAGSCAVSLNTKFDSYICNDINADLIKMYDLIHTDLDNFIQSAQTYFVNGNDEPRYYELRELYNNTNDPNQKAYLFLYLNRHCFNGLCRYNSKGKFNVPFGSYKTPYFPEKEIREFNQFTLNKFKFTNQNFQEMFDYADEDTVIYCDPPYSPLTKTSDFSKYAVNDFNPSHHIELKNLALKASTEKKCTVIISNHDTDYTRDLYKEADDIIAFDVKRTISSKINERKKAPEVLAIYKGK
jgi:DNA adenine methylase